MTSIDVRDLTKVHGTRRAVDGLTFSVPPPCGPPSGASRARSRRAPPARSGCRPRPRPTTRRRP
ncbi:hypothetical protein ACVNF4_36055, partial [Streptomyces sp. S6]